MKKIITVVMINILLLGSSVGIISTIYGQQIQNIDESTINGCNCEGIVNPDNGDFGEYYRTMSIPLDCSQFEITHPTGPLRDVPDEFSWLDVDGEDWTTPAKHQGNCGSCWDFAALGALEGRIKIMEDCAKLRPDLSEQYVLSCLPAAANNYGQGCLGGTPYNAYYYIMDEGEEGNNANGIIDEMCFSYQASHTVPCDDKCVDWMDHLVPLTDCEEIFLGLDYATEENTNIIKTLIYEDGPVAVALNVTNDFITYWNLHHSADDYYPDTHEPWGNMLNHIVVLVGWKDDPEIENGGYWIVKNSWGTDWGYDGFFNIEYYGLFIGMYYATASYNPDDVDWAPVADAGGLYQADVDELITFDGSDSVDAEGEILSYEWDFGDDTTGEGINPTHSYVEEGIYEVTLTVSDSIGQLGTDTALVGVGQEPLTIDASGIFGITISIQTSLDTTLTYLDWNAEMHGLILPRETSGKILLLSQNEPFSKQTYVLGLGFGSITIAVENIEKSEQFVILGPFVFGLHLQ